MTADATPLPGEPLTGRHRPERLYPLGVEIRHAVARSGYRWTPTHTHHASETAA